MKTVGSTKNMVGGGGDVGSGLNATGPLAGMASESICGNLFAMVSAIVMMLLLL